MFSFVCFNYYGVATVAIVCVVLYLTQTIAISLVTSQQKHKTKSLYFYVNIIYVASVATASIISTNRKMCQSICSGVKSLIDTLWKASTNVSFFICTWQ